MFTVTPFDRFTSALAAAGVASYLIACAHLVQLLVTVLS